MRLYTNKFTRGTRPRWLIEEAGLPVECIEVNLQAGEHKSPEHLARHPHGKVPVLLDGDTAIIESGAITLYLADKAPGFAPPVGTLARGLYYQWCFWAVATLEQGVAQVFGENRKPEAERNPAAIEAGKKAYHDCLGVLTHALEGRTWLLGEDFTAADILVISILAWAGAMKLNEGFPTVEAYVARGKARPAFARARA